MAYVAMGLPDAKRHDAMSSALRALRWQIGSSLQATLHNGSPLSKEHVTEIFDTLRECGMPFRISCVILVYRHRII